MDDIIDWKWNCKIERAAGKFERGFILILMYDPPASGIYIECRKEGFTSYMVYKSLILTISFDTAFCHRLSFLFYLSAEYELGQLSWGLVELYHCVVITADGSINFQTTVLCVC